MGHLARRGRPRRARARTGLRRQLRRLLRPRHHGGRPDRGRTALRALPLRGAQRSPRYRHRLRAPRPREASSSTSTSATAARTPRWRPKSSRTARARRSATSAKPSGSRSPKSTPSRKSTTRASRSRGRLRAPTSPEHDGGGAAPRACGDGATSTPAAISGARARRADDQPAACRRFRTRVTCRASRPSTRRSARSLALPRRPPPPRSSAAAARSRDRARARSFGEQTLGGLRL